MTDESVQNQASSAADGVESKPAVAEQTGILVVTVTNGTVIGSGGGGVPNSSGPVVAGRGGGQVSGVSTTGTGVAGWIESKANTFDAALHDRVARLENAAKSVAAKVEGDAIADLKALVQHLHSKYDAVVTRVAALEAHIEGRFGSI